VASGIFCSQRLSERLLIFGVTNFYSRSEGHIFMFKRMILLSVLLGGCVIQMPAQLGSTGIAPMTSAKTVPLTPKEIAQKVLASTVVILTADANGRGLALGSGFVARPGIIVTNHHVIQGANAAIVRTVEGSTRAEVTQIIATDQFNDIAVIAAPGMPVPPLSLGDDKGIALGLDYSRSA
jgi:S1-C subfamily serine protease